MSLLNKLGNKIGRPVCTGLSALTFLVTPVAYEGGCETMNTIAMMDMAEAQRRQADAEERKEYPHVIKVNGKWKPEEGYTWVNPKDSDDLRVRLIESMERERLDLPQGFKAVQHNLEKFVLCSCIEAGDFNNDGITTYPAEFRGIKKEFAQNETMTLYCGGETLRKDWRLLIFNLTSGKSCYDKVNNSNGYGIVPKFECSNFGPGKFLAIFSQGEQQIGTLDFEITSE